MSKTLTKEQLAAKLDKWEYGKCIPKETIQVAKENNLVIISSRSDDTVKFEGAICNEDSAYDGGITYLSRKGIPENECIDECCPYYERWIKSAIKSGEVQLLEVYWCSQCDDKKMDAEEYALLGRPTWCYKTTMPHAVFSVYETVDDEQDYYCRGIVIDLDEVWGPTETN